MEKNSLADRVTNEKVLHRVKEDRNIPHTIKRKANSIGYIWRGNYLLKPFIEGKERSVGVIGRRRGRRKQLLDDPK